MRLSAGLRALPCLAVASAFAVAPTPVIALQQADTPAVEAASTPEGVPGGVLALLANGVATGGLRENEREALKAFYARGDAAMVWTDAQGLTATAKAAIAEIRRADEFGLDPSAFKLPDALGPTPSPEALAKAEMQLSRAVLIYARHAGGGRVAPGKVGHQLVDAPALPEPAAVLEAVSSSDDMVAYLRSLHPSHPQFEALREKLAELRGDREQGSRVKLPDGPVLRQGMAGARVVTLRKRLGVTGGEGAKGEQFDDAVTAAVKKFQRENGLTADGVVGAGTRRALNKGTSETKILKLLVNMERWRWLADDLDGDAGIYVWANIPEFRVRIVKGDKVVFKERVIVGKTNKQTPVFSDEMEWIEFHPTWYVPNSIKKEDILPSLRRPTSKVMERYHLRLNCGRHGRDPKMIDWNTVDIRNCSISQPPGQRSVLGDFKFKFPNKHAVYMHDTPTKGLFNRQTRTFSHGCVRIRNPRRMAEILLEHDKGLTSTRVGQILAGPRSLHKEDLNRNVPVHITYFTMLFDADGTLVNSADYYGHDRRLAQALTGKGHLLPVVAAPARRKRPPRRRETSVDRWSEQSFSLN
ncbi:MAG: L,D-transpeptidase family protein [Hyphomicrobiales bacterium]|nr:L,D-transpeptidase family protein [Hyphomicrobiales bacterium]